MRYTTWLMISLCVGIVPSTFAAEPAQTPSPPAQASPAAPSEAPTSVTAATADATTPVAATPPATATPPTSKTEAVKPTDLVAQAKRLRTAGYKPKVQKNGDTVWCRSEASLGSRFQSERCSSADDLDRAALSGRELTETIQKNVTQRQSN